MGQRRGEAEFQFPEHLREWSPDGAIGHFTFHSERCKAAPQFLKLIELQRMVNCDMCVGKGRHD